MQLFVLFFSALIFHIFFYRILVTMTSHCIHIKTFRPKLTTPQLTLNLRMLYKNLSGRDTLYRLDDFCRTVCRTLWIRKCTWSLSVPISINSISYLFELYFHQQLRRTPTVDTSMDIHNGTIALTHCDSDRYMCSILAHFSKQASGNLTLRN